VTYSPEVPNYYCSSGNLDIVLKLGNKFSEIRSKIEKENETSYHKYTLCCIDLLGQGLTEESMREVRTQFNRSVKLEFRVKVCAELPTLKNKFRELISLLGMPSHIYAGSERVGYSVIQEKGYKLAGNWFSEKREIVPVKATLNYRTKSIEELISSKENRE
ncbi:MAG: hypothetical protein AABX39_00185, partial [Nanoarchaeota archaeon]